MFNVGKVVQLSFRCIQSDSLQSSHFTTLQSVYRVVNNVVRIAMTLLLSVSPDLSLGVLTAVFMLEAIVSGTFLTPLTAALVAVAKLYGAALLEVSARCSADA